MNLKNKNVLVYGMSLSGEWATKLLLKLKANVFLYDDNWDKLKAKSFKNCFLIQELNENLISQFDFLIVSPSIEKENKYLVIAKKLNKKIYSEIEFASMFSKNIVAVTGTNGKTTTVEMITAILNKKYKAVACGNIGYPMSRAVLEKKRYIKVAEVSSFMLENAESFSPHVATVLNIEPDHLIRHKTMDEYQNLKLSIFKNLKPHDYAVVNLELNIHPTINCLTVTYSYKHIADVYIKDGCIYLHQNKIVAINELKLKGKHNIYNAMCAICYAYIYRIPPRLIREALINFKGERYRIEFIGKIDEINFVNDSKSTNISSTLASVDTVKGAVILLLGGSKKGLDYTKLFDKLNKKVRQVVVFGETADDFVTANSNRFNIEKFHTMSAAFDFAVSIAKPHDTILLSPATASYDQYKNYIERGRDFDKLVKEYEVKTKKE